MFDILSEKLSKIIRDLTGKGRLTQENIQQVLRDIRVSLLEADVALSVIDQFVSFVKEKALGQEVIAGVNPGDAFVKIVHDELINVMGGYNEINLKTTPPAVILMVGLQGSGKTTTSAKLANFLKDQKKNVLLLSVDVYRPAAIDQLKVLAGEIGVDFFQTDKLKSPVKIAKDALKEAKKSFYDVVIIDTAGRLHVDKEMMKEVRALHKETRPIETFFVLDSMTGQDAVFSVKAFSEALPLTGIVLTKTDGDARGGVALSARMITQKPIKFMGTGEKIDNFEVFHPDRIVSRIFGMGDILSLVEEAEKKIDKKKAGKIAKKITKGGTFDFQDFKEQLTQMKTMGGLGNLMSKLPGLSALKSAKNALNDDAFKRMEC